MTLADLVFKQARAEMKGRSQEDILEYINCMNNFELLELVSRAQENNK
jgi:hypothetical protein